MYVYLTMTAGSRAGTNYLLDATEENRIGRGGDCAIVVDDPLCSRVHAAIVQENGAWSIWDAKSRNGTFVNAIRVADSAIKDGDHLRVGSTEFSFRQSPQPPTLSAMPSGNMEATATLHGQTINERYEKLLERDSVKLDYWEKKLIAEALRRAKGDVPAAARLLGIGRATLYRKIAEHNIPR
jgi:pSer/pThr/pTyr-binding forkhead associated (FHA) protein